MELNRNDQDTALKYKGPYQITNAEINERERIQENMQYVRELVRQKSEKLGRPLFAKVVTLGCQMNITFYKKYKG